MPLNAFRAAFPRTLPALAGYLALALPCAGTFVRGGVRPAPTVEAQ